MYIIYWSHNQTFPNFEHTRITFMDDTGVNIITMKKVCIVV